MVALRGVAVRLPELLTRPGVPQPDRVVAAARSHHRAMTLNEHPLNVAGLVLGLEQRFRVLTPRNPIAVFTPAELSAATICDPRYLGE